MKIVNKFCACAALCCTLLSAEERLASTTPALIMEESTVFEVSSYTGDGIIDQISVLKEWVAREFANYPYLWVAPKDDLCEGNALLLTEENALVTIVRREGEVVGVAAGVPFDSEGCKAYLGQSVIDEAIEKGFDLSKMIYMLYFLTASEYRNDQSLVDMIYNNYLEFAHEQKRTQIGYFEYSGKADHPLKPENPTAIEPWGVVIPGKTMDVKAHFPWPTLQADGSVNDEVHEVEFFYRET